MRRNPTDSPSKVSPNKSTLSQSLTKKQKATKSPEIQNAPVPSPIPAEKISKGSSMMSAAKNKLTTLFGGATNMIQRANPFKKPTDAARAPAPNAIVDELSPETVQIGDQENETQEMADGKVTSNLDDELEQIQARLSPRRARMMMEEPSPIKRELPTPSKKERYGHSKIGDQLAKRLPWTHQQPQEPKYRPDNYLGMSTEEIASRLAPVILRRADDENMEENDGMVEDIHEALVDDDDFEGQQLTVVDGELHVRRERLKLNDDFVAVHAHLITQYPNINPKPIFRNSVANMMRKAKKIRQGPEQINSAAFGSYMKQKESEKRKEKQRRDHARKQMTLNKDRICSAARILKHEMTKTQREQLEIAVALSTTELSRKEKVQLARTEYFVPESITEKAISVMAADMQAAYLGMIPAGIPYYCVPRLSDVLHIADLFGCESIESFEKLIAEGTLMKAMKAFSQISKGESNTEGGVFFDEMDLYNEHKQNVQLRADLDEAPELAAQVNECMNLSEDSHGYDDASDSEQLAQMREVLSKKTTEYVLRPFVYGLRFTYIILYNLYLVRDHKKLPFGLTLPTYTWLYIFGLLIDPDNSMGLRQDDTRYVLRLGNFNLLSRIEINRTDTTDTLKKLLKPTLSAGNDLSSMKNVSIACCVALVKLENLNNRLSQLSADRSSCAYRIKNIHNQINKLIRSQGLDNQLGISTLMKRTSKAIEIGSRLLTAASQNQVDAARDDYYSFLQLGINLEQPTMDQMSRPLSQHMHQYCLALSAIADKADRQREQTFGWFAEHIRNYLSSNGDKDFSYFMRVRENKVLLSMLKLACGGDAAFARIDSIIKAIYSVFEKGDFMAFPLNGALEDFEMSLEEFGNCNMTAYMEIAGNPNLVKLVCGGLDNLNQPDVEPSELSSQEDSQESSGLKDDPEVIHHVEPARPYLPNIFDTPEKADAAPMRQEHRNNPFDHATYNVAAQERFELPEDSYFPSEAYKVQQMFDEQSEVATTTTRELLSIGSNARMVLTLIGASEDQFNLTRLALAGKYNPRLCEALMRGLTEMYITSNPDGGVIDKNLMNRPFEEGATRHDVEKAFAHVCYVSSFSEELPIELKSRLSDIERLFLSMTDTSAPLIEINN